MNTSRAAGILVLIGVTLTLSKPGISQTPPQDTPANSAPSPSPLPSSLPKPQPVAIPPALLTEPKSTEVENSSDGDFSEPSVKAPAGVVSGLSREHASARSRNLTAVDYALSFKLDPASPFFEAKATVRFELRQRWAELSASEQAKALFLDFEGGEIDSLKINGKEPQANRYDGLRVRFLPAEVQVGKNEIEIKYRHSYSKNGYGFHFFKDPEDGRSYLFTNFEPYFANRVFPCFDQPDLKAPFALEVEAPKDWVVVSNAQEKETSAREGKKTWTFEKTPPLSTYFFALHAGQYHTWKSSASIAITPEEEGGPRQAIPLRLFARQALVKYVHPEEWFTLTRSGLDFFTSFFGTPFSFSKYDQIIAPDMMGAMENPGAVTFSEAFVFRTKTTQMSYRARASTLLHEMAHMWFGNLVTMRWWSGLWLNESFATFMAVLATERATPFQDAWVNFLANSKHWAYRADQAGTSHPVEVAVHDTSQADAIFDAITYGKGAAVLRQLTHYIGEDDFKEALQRYFNKFSFKNTSKGDFVKVLSEASGQNIDHWQKTWLQSTGMNTISVHWTCDWDENHKKRRLEKFEVEQLGQPLRPRKLQITLFPEKWPAGGKLAPTLVDLTLQKPVTPVLEVIRKPCPSAVLPNFNDLDYAKIELDSTSRVHLIKHLDKVSEPITRMMLWHYLWNEVLDSHLSVEDYLETALKQAPLERNVILLEKILQTLGSQTTREGSVLKYLPEPKRTAANEALEKLILKNLLRASAGSDLQLVWYQAYLNLAQTTEGLQFLRALLEGKKKLKGIELDQSKRWGLIAALAANSDSDLEQKLRTEILAEEKKDPSYSGKKAAAAAIASLPSEENKVAWIEKFKEISISLPLARDAMATFFPMGREKQMQALEPTYFDLLKSLHSNNKPEAEAYLFAAALVLYPASCEPSIVEKTKEFLSQNINLPSRTRKALQNQLEEEMRCLLIRKNGRANLKP